MTKKYVFGPVPSWRLGNSLGVDPIPLKTCNWNCVYCQLGRSQPVTLGRARYVPERAVIHEVETTLASLGPREIDWVTFVGCGETLLHSNIGWMLREAKQLTHIPIAVITNGSLFSHSDIRRDVAVADAVLPSLDVGTEDLFRRMNRPHHRATFERHTQGLTAFRDEYDGQIWIEVMLVRELNDGEHELQETAELLKRLRPDEIHINGPTRSPVEQWVECPDPTAVVRAANIFESVAPVRVVRSTAGSLSLTAGESVVDAALQILTRHPLSQAELQQALEQRAPGRAQEIIAQIEACGRARKVVRCGTEYWVSEQTHFPG